MKTEIEQGRLEELERAFAMLSALEANGVDNWVGYEDAVSEIQRRDKFNNYLNQMLQEMEEIILKDAYEPSERGSGYVTSDEAHYKALGVLKNMVIELKGLASS